MKYNLSIIQIGWLVLLISFGACSERDYETGNPTGRKGEIVFAPTVEGIEDIATKASANNFFVNGDTIRVSILGSETGSTYSDFMYLYDSISGLFYGNPAYLFPLDDSYIDSLTAVWPYQAENNGIFIDDQREYNDHRRADWLVAKAVASGVMPTDVPVPLLFEHNNCLLEFELVGQSAEGLAIRELLIDLVVNGKQTACYAYCKNENGRASFLVPAGTALQSKENLLLGIIIGETGDRYSIILNNVSITFQAGKRYLFTLVPRGYNLEAYLTIGGWTDELEAGIGIPFHKPTEAQELQGIDYVIYTPAQLITMSYLMRHYWDGSTIPWPTLTYLIDDNFQLTEEYADQYIPIPRSLPFTGEIIYQGEPTDTIVYNGNQVLPLFIDE